MSRIRLAGLRVALVGLVAAAALVVAPVGGAGHGTGYWFFQGYLPTGSGDRTAGPHANFCCNVWNEVRMSWTTGSHDMTFILVRRSDYGWSGFRAYAADGYDQYIYYQVADYTAGGCQNPAGLSTVWVNCHIGNA